MLHDLEHRISDAGYKLDDYFRLQGTTVARTTAIASAAQAEQRVKEPAGRVAVGRSRKDRGDARRKSTAEIETVDQPAENAEQAKPSQVCESEAGQHGQS